MKSLPDLIHFYNAHESHPFLFYQALTDLTVRLGVIFDIFEENCVDDLPPYNHEAPAKGLQRLTEMLQTMFGWIPRTRKGVFALESVSGRENVFSADLSSCAFSDNVEFYIWAASDMPDGEFQSRFPRDFRVASPERIDQLITFAVPGVTLTWVSNPPVMLDPPANGHYFRLEKRDAEWQDIIQTKSLSLAGPIADFPNLQVRLHELRP
jgi:type VI secretion system protein ImpJ